MHFFEILTTVLLFFTYTYSVTHSGQLSKHTITVKNMVAGIVFIHVLYALGGFYDTFGIPQIVLVGWDVLGSVLVVAIYNNKHIRYNIFRTFMDCFVTLSCLIYGGFYN